MEQKPTEIDITNLSNRQMALVITGIILGGCGTIGLVRLLLQVFAP